MTETGRSIVVFDLGGVLIDWDPRHLYRKLFAGDEAAMEHFLATGLHARMEPWPGRRPDLCRWCAPAKDRASRCGRVDRRLLRALRRDDARPDPRLGRDPGRAQSLGHAPL